VSREEPPAWTVVVPLKPFAEAKSRLAVRADARARLARSMAADTLDSIVACDSVAEVVVVTREVEEVDLIAPVGVRTVREPGATGLNGAISLGMRIAGLHRHRIAIVGDLPFLRGEDLAAALEMAQEHPRAMVPDRDGTGTTAITARAGVEARPQFGTMSFVKHFAGGHTPLDVDPRSTLRWDVDCIEDLQASRFLRPGECTDRAIAAMTARELRDLALV